LEARQVTARGDGLAIVLSRHEERDGLFSSGEVQSTELYTHGYFETRMQAPRGSGLVSGFFTYSRPGVRGHWDELDIEILGRDTTQVQFTMFHAGARRAVTVPLGFDAAQGFHSYGFEWLPDRIRWYVDGRLLHEARGDLPNAPQRLISHLWNSATLGEWAGPIDAERASWTLRVACIAHAERYDGVSLCAPAPKPQLLAASREVAKRS
jgi:beta-glucanase (GH16 family)